MSHKSAQKIFFIGGEGGSFTPHQFLKFPILAEEVGFEPTMSLKPMRLFESRAFNHSATLPNSLDLFIKFLVRGEPSRYDHFGTSPRRSCLRAFGFCLKQNPLALRQALLFPKNPFSKSWQDFWEPCGNLTYYTKKLYNTIGFNYLKTQF